MTNETANSDILEMAADLTRAWLSNPNTRVSADEVPSFLQSMHGAVTKLAAPAVAPEEAPEVEHKPAVTVRRSLASKDHIISLIDGKPYKTLKRHLSGHGLTPAQYRERFGLKADYPMVAETYAEMRRSMARRIGLGRKPGTKVAAAEPAAKAEAKPKAAAKPKAPKSPKAAKVETAEAETQS